MKKLFIILVCIISFLCCIKNEKKTEDEIFQKKIDNGSITISPKGSYKFQDVFKNDYLLIYVAPDSFINFTDPDWNEFLSERNISDSNQPDNWASGMTDVIYANEPNLIIRIEYDLSTKTFYILYYEVYMNGGYYLVKSFKNENQEYDFSYYKIGRPMPELKTILGYLKDENISLGRNENEGFPILTELELFLSKVLGYLENQFYGNDKVRLQIDNEE